MRFDIFFLWLSKNMTTDCSYCYILYKNCSAMKKETENNLFRKDIEFKDIFWLNWCIALIRNNLYQNCEKIPLHYKSFTYLMEFFLLIKSFFVRNTVYKLPSEKIGRILDLSTTTYYNATTIIKVCT